MRACVLHLQQFLTKWLQNTFAINFSLAYVLDAGEMICCTVFTQYVKMLLHSNKTHYQGVDEQHARKQAIFCCVISLTNTSNVKERPP